MRHNSQIRKHNEGQQEPGRAPSLPASDPASEIAVSLLTGGSDRPYVYGLTTSLILQGVNLDLIGSDELDLPEIRALAGLRFFNLRGSSRSDASFTNKVWRILQYYFKLVRYTATAKPRILHILWNNKFEFFDRTFLMIYYKLRGKRVVLTVHNVNAARRDLKDTWLNRFTLRIQYRLSDHIFVHTEVMKRELVEEFGALSSRVAVIPFGINNAVPNTCLTPEDAKRRLGLRPDEKAILFFGRITPYKGLELLIDAVRQARTRCPDYRLIIAGRPDRCEEYWSAIREQIRGEVERGEILLKAEFIPDEETEVFFKAADAFALPYRDIYQSGVLFLGQSFGLPALVADVGSLKDDVIEGETGFVFKPEDPDDLANAIEIYFANELYQRLPETRKAIRHYVETHHSWDAIGQTTVAVYESLLKSAPPELAKAQTASQSKSTEKSTSNQSNVQLQNNSSAGRL